MAFLLALDQGTSSSRAILFDAVGRVLAAAQRGFDQLFPHDGWVEQPPETLWTTTLTAGREAIAKSGVRPADIAAIGIANQRETTLVWDARSGATVGNAIVWQDRRTAARCQRMLLEGMEAELVDATGLLVDPYFSSTKLEWLLQDPAVKARALAGRAQVRHGGQFSRMALDQGYTPRHGRNQRCAYPTLRHWPSSVERALAGLLRRAARHAARRTGLRGGFRCGGSRVVRCADPNLRRGWRSAGGLDRPRMLRARRNQVYLRHRLFPNRQYWPGTHALQVSVADDGGLSHRWRADLRPGGAPFSTLALPSSGCATSWG